MHFHREAAVVLVHFRDATLEVDLSPRRGVIVVGPATEPEPGAEPLPAVLAEVGALRDERVIVMRFRRVRGRKPHPALVVELLTNRWNAILADGPELRVRKRLRAVRSSPHPIGQPWVAPGIDSAALTRQPVDSVQWRNLVEGVEPPEARSALLSRVEYLSGLNVAYLLDAPDPDEGFRRWQVLAEGRDAVPCVLRRTSGLQPYPWPLDDADAKPAASLLEAMQQVRAASESGRLAPHGQIARRLDSQSRRLARKLQHLRAQLENTARAADLRQDGALILSSLHLIEPGTARVSLTGFDGVQRTFVIEPGVRPQEHANTLFRRATRLERAAEALPMRIGRVEEEIANISALQARHAAGGLAREEVEALLPTQLPPSPRGRPPTPGGEPPPLPYRRYTSSRGIEIRVGRGARRNDALTFRHSRPDDVWLHARHATGAHVIMRWARPERPPAADLAEAATLAANHSGARGSGQVPVDWTRRKWVRKPRGAPPGVVTPDRVETLFVEPDPSLMERLEG